MEEAGDDAEDAVVREVLPSATPLELPLGGEEADAATDGREEFPDGDVIVVLDLLVPASGVGLFRDVDVVRSWGEATLVEDVESAYLQLEVEGADEGVTPCRSGAAGSE